MFRKPILLNVVLLIASGALAYNVSQMWLSSFQPRMGEGLVEETEVVQASLDKEEKGEIKPTSLSSYDVIGEQNVFRPQRQEWTPPPKSPVKPPSAPPKKPEPSPPSPLPDPVLMGIILEEDGNKIAIMQGHRRQEVNIKSRRRGKMPSRIVADKVGTYHEGDTISEAVILEIHEDKVVIERDGQKIDIAMGNKGNEPIAPAPSRGGSVKTQLGASPYSVVPSLLHEQPEGKKASPSSPTGLSRSERLKKLRESWRKKRFLRR